MADEVGQLNPDIWTAQAFLTKFQKYMEQAGKFEKKDWQYGLWSSLALESLLRAALSKVSPVLLADAADWNNLVFGLGKSPIAKKFNPKTVATADVISRLESLFPEFGSDHATTARGITGKRNSELHTAEDAFTGENASGWLARYFKLVFALLQILAAEPIDVLGEGEVDYAKKLIAAEDDVAAKTVNKTINAHKTVWGEKTEEQREELRAQAIAWASQTAGHRVSCPSCDCQALVTGDPNAPPVVSVEDDEIVEKQKYLPSKFECIGCQLKISGFSKLAVAGMADEFTRTSHQDKYDYAASVMEEYIEYEPDYNC